jgi:hypothetical protein
MSVGFNGLLLGVAHAWSGKRRRRNRRIRITDDRCGSGSAGIFDRDQDSNTASPRSSSPRRSPASPGRAHGACHLADLRSPLPGGPTIFRLGSGRFFIVTLNNDIARSAQSSNSFGGHQPCVGGELGCGTADGWAAGHDDRRTARSNGRNDQALARAATPRRGKAISQAHPVPR